MGNLNLTRRQFLRGGLTLAGVGLLVGCGVRPGPPASPTKRPTVGVLLFSTPAADVTFNAFLQGLGALGYSEGENLAIETRYAEGKPERLPELADELVRLKPDVIFALGGDVVADAKRATGTIPVVFAISADPVQSGFVANLARPDANLTGVTFLSSVLAGKRVELLQHLLPQGPRVGILWNPEHADTDFQGTQAAATALGVQLRSHEVRGRGDFDGAYHALVNGSTDGLIVVPSRLTSLHRQEIAQFALRQRLPLIAGWGVFAQAGGLLSYGPNLDDMVRRAATYVDKILNGAKPAELPVEQPTEFELVVNLATAQALGVTIPQSVRQQATQVIQ